MHRQKYETGSLVSVRCMDIADTNDAIVQLLLIDSHITRTTECILVTMVQIEQFMMITALKSNLTNIFKLTMS